MNEITKTGDGLSVLIDCKHTRQHGWMSFASWYSINKNLPDAEILLICEREAPSEQYFIWTYRAGVKFFMYRKENYDSLIDRVTKDKGVKIIKPYVMAVRDYKKECVGPVDVKSDEASTFVSYLNGCGKFVTSKWIDKREPFEEAYKIFHDYNFTVNEMKILKLWERSHQLYVKII